MLGKLFKHEMKESSRYLVPLVLSLIILTIVNKIFFSINSQFLAFNLMKGIFVFILISIDITIFVATIIIIILRFYKNLLGDEGYLMFTLPVKVSYHIIVKVLTSTIWVIISTSIELLSMFFIFGNLKDFNSIVVNFLESDQKILSIIFLIELIVLIIVSIAFNILQVYTSISIGQLVQKHKILASFGVYIGIYIIFQIIASVIIVIIAALRETFSFDLLENIKLDSYSGHFAVLAFIGIILVINTAYFMTTKWILSKKINLE